MNLLCYPTGIHITGWRYPGLERVVTLAVDIRELHAAGTEDNTYVEKGLQFREICRRQSYTYAIHATQSAV